jgi:hypothetical protein
MRAAGAASVWAPPERHIFGPQRKTARQDVAPLCSYTCAVRRMHCSRGRLNLSFQCIDNGIRTHLALLSRMKRSAGPRQKVWQVPPAPPAILCFARPFGGFCLCFAAAQALCQRHEHQRIEYGTRWLEGDTKSFWGVLWILLHTQLPLRYPPPSQIHIHTLPSPSQTHTGHTHTSHLNAHCTV